MLFKTERRKELEDKEAELYLLKSEIQQLKDWCFFDSPEIGIAMLYLQKRDISLSEFRDKLRRGVYTADEFKKQQRFYGSRFKL